jgi:hypothetical protein
MNGLDSHILRNDLIRSRSLAECWSVRIAPETIRAWPLPARPALSLARRTLGLTARRFVDFGRTESMMCLCHAA